MATRATVLTLLLLLVSAGCFACLTAAYIWTKPRLYTETTLWVRTGWGQAQIASEMARLTALPALPIQIGLRLSATQPLKAGEYDLAKQPSLMGLTSAMQNGDVIKRSVTIPEGLTSYQILAKIRGSFGITDDCPDFKTIPEASLLPETYAYTRGDSCVTLLNRMKATFDERIKGLWEQRDPTVPYKDMQEALVMASIVEKETGIPAERPRVAGVFVNRLRLGMPMQSDPTTIYGLSGGTGILDRELTRADWKIAHPYNTYTIPALPPGPITHPGIDSIKAALHPEPHTYLYFKATGIGGHNFAETLDEHNKNTIIK